jgi:hypothetical protein
MRRVSSIHRSVLLLSCVCLAAWSAAGCRIVRGAVDPPGQVAARAAVDTPHECATIDGTLAALYDVISGEAGETRDWARFEGLFHPEWGRLGSARPAAQQGEASPRFATRPLTPAEYRELATPFFEQAPFYETEASRALERYGPIAHAFSTYESRRSADATEEPFARGINSVQLFHDGARWWVVSIFWYEEDAEHALPEHYLAE